MGNIFGGGGGEPPAPYQFIQCSNTQAGSTGNCCNGLDGLCDFGVNEIMWATTHNAHSSREGIPFLYNNLYEFEDSLEAGYRGVGIDVCKCGDVIQLCHGVCNIGARSPLEVFGNTVDFLTRNPTEVILFTMQLDYRFGAFSLDELDDVLGNVPGLKNMIYVHPTDGQPWPTLGELKASGKRILMFHYNGPDCGNAGECPLGLHYWFQYAAETRFSFNGVSDFDDAAWSCEITRGAGSTKDFFAVNTFTTPASQSDAEAMNSQEFLESRINSCSLQNGFLDVNLVSVNFFSIGDLPQVVQLRNQDLVSYGRA